MEFLLQNPALVEFEPAESLPLSFLIEADPLSTPRIHHGCTVDRILLMPVKVSRSEKLVVSRDGGFSDMCLLSEGAFEPFDRVVSQKYVDISFARQSLAGQWVLFRTESGAETHTGNIDRRAYEMENLRRWPRILQEVNMSRLGVDGQG